MSQEERTTAAGNPGKKKEKETKYHFRKVGNQDSYFPELDRSCLLFFDKAQVRREKVDGQRV